uniref:Uncharacterized protein n=1 Tax=Caenorhabditis tropicalis TaxID=1561998 RepID=A0A1I7UAI3_9PELO
MPKHVAVRSNGRMTLIKTCKRLSTYSECIDETAPTCSPFNTTLCNTTLKVDEKKVFIRDFGEWTVVASFFETYTTFLSRTYATHAMDISRHVALRLPQYSWARFGGTTVFGRALHNFDHFPIYIKVEVPHVNADDIDSLEKQYGKKPILAESRKMLMSVQDDPVMSELPYVAIFLLGSVFILTSVLLALICCRYIRNRKDGKEKKEAVRVIYSNENCEIVV